VENEEVKSMLEWKVKLKLTGTIEDLTKEDALKNFLEHGEIEDLIVEEVKEIGGSRDG